MAEDKITFTRYGSTVVDMPHLTPEEQAEAAKEINERMQRFNEELVRGSMRASRGETP